MNNYILFFFRFYNKKRIYYPIDYACIDETDFWIVDEDQPVELDVEELENLLYEEGSIPINEGLMWRTLVLQILIFNLHIPISKMNEDMNFIFISMQKSS
ncbi:hypothetical protein AAG906_009072 [Vitis piasezkii]